MWGEDEIMSDEMRYEGETEMKRTMIATRDEQDEWNGCERVKWDSIGH